MPDLVVRYKLTWISDDLGGRSITFTIISRFILRRLEKQTDCFTEETFLKIANYITVPVYLCSAETFHYL